MSGYCRRWPSSRPGCGSIGPGGCKTYRFAVGLNRTYRFKTCGPEGSANFDTVIQTTTNSQSCFPGPSNDDFCGLQSSVTLTSRFSQFITVSVRGWSAASAGDFTLAYKDVTDECPTCPNHTTVAGTPTPDWNPPGPGSWEFDGTHHRGVDDAWNIARVLGHLLVAAKA